MLVKENEWVEQRPARGPEGPPSGCGRDVFHPGQPRPAYRKMLLLAIDNQCGTKKTHISTLVKLITLFAQKLQGVIISELYQIDEVKEAIRIIGFSKLPGMGVACGHRNLL